MTSSGKCSPSASNISSAFNFELGEVVFRIQEHTNDQNISEPCSNSFLVCLFFSTLVNEKKMTFMNILLRNNYVLPPGLREDPVRFVDILSGS